MRYRITIERHAPTGVLASADAELEEEGLRLLLRAVRDGRGRGLEELEHALEWALYAEAEVEPGRTYGPEGGAA
jgi:hypothetical protein